MSTTPKKEAKKLLDDFLEAIDPGFDISGRFYVAKAATLLHLVKMKKITKILMPLLYDNFCEIEKEVEYMDYVDEGGQVTITFNK